MPRVGQREYAIADLVEFATAGDRYAFARLVDTFNDTLRRRLRRLDIQESDCDDIIEEAFFRCWAKLHLLKDPEKFGAWVQAITNTVTRRWLARRLRERQRLAFMPTESLFEVARDQPSGPSEQDLATLFDGLSADEALILERRFVHRLGLSEIGALMGMTVDQVRRRVERARVRFQSLHLGWAG